MGSSFIHRNTNNDVCIVDIPHSISEAQTLPGQPCHRLLLSTPPQETSFHGNEPRLESRAKDNHVKPVDHELHEKYARVIQAALCGIERGGYKGRFCEERKILPTHLTLPRKRKAESVDHGLVKETYCRDEAMFDCEHPVTVTGLDNLLRQTVYRKVSLLSVESPKASGFEASPRKDFYIAQSASDPTELQLPDPQIGQPSTRVRVPPGSAFIIGDCQDTNKLQQCTRIYSPKTHGLMNFILLDPPWPNRSASRKDSYSTATNLTDIMDLLHNMDLDTLLLPDGYLAMWITNKSLIRSQLIGKHGLFDMWNLKLVEEWIWVKVTPSGEPILQLDSGWRKPYEILLVGKKQTDESEKTYECIELKRRVLFAVPDLHSRKPCIKPLIEEFLLKSPNSYSAMEIFARYLVSGWFSWGDQVIKYNCNPYWAEEEG